MPVYTDQLGHAVDIPQAPQRIVSLVPSITELLYHLGLNDRVAGITKFCVHPGAWFRTKQRVGGTKAVKTEVIHRIHPDLIIANKEENLREQVDELSRYYPVYTTHVKDLEGALEMIKETGTITGTTEKAAGIIHSIRSAFAELIHGPALSNDYRQWRTCYLIWRNPLMTVGGDTFIHDMLHRCGLQNIFRNVTRYPQITIEELQQQNCQLLILSSEPYPFKESHIAEFKTQLPDTRIVLADGEMFSWYGSRLLEAPGYFGKLLEQIAGR